jgi:hypothetical protein
VSEETFWRVVGVFVLVIAAFAGAFWKHVVEDAKVRERVASLETDNTTVKSEVKGLRDHFHDFRDSLPQRVKELVEWFKGK